MGATASSSADFSLVEPVTSLTDHLLFLLKFFFFFSLLRIVCYFREVTPNVESRLASQ